MASRKLVSALFATCIFCLFFSAPVAAFGPGTISASSKLKGYMARHGDIEDILIDLPLSFVTQAQFKAPNTRRVYFGNWLRDFSRLIDAGTLAYAPAALIHVIVTVLGVMEFGYGTREYEVNSHTLGVYRPEEHIDNPKAYPNDAQSKDERLRGPVQPIELEIDIETGMKNYIANDALGIATSSDFIRQQLNEAIRLGRQKDDTSKLEAMRHLGAALHTLEAHTNYVELCLLLLSKKDSKLASLGSVYAFVGDNARVETREGTAPPLVSGTFGPLDALDSVLGEINDQKSSKLGDLGLLDQRLGSSPPLSDTFGGFISLALPQELGNKLKSLEDFKPAGGSADDIDFDMRSLSGSPEQIRQLRDGVWSILEAHDDIRRVIEGVDLGPIKENAHFVYRLSNVIDKFLFKQLTPYLKPLIKNLRGFLEEQRKTMHDQAAKSIEDPEDDVLAVGSIATNPTHTMLNKDHVENVLNNPAGLVAAAITSYTAHIVVCCWDNHNIKASDAIGNILEALHHPFNASPNSTLQQSMFKCVKNWWNLKENDDQRRELLAYLTKDAVLKGKTHFDVDDAHFKPSDYCLLKLLPGSREKPVLQVVANNLLLAQQTRQLNMSTAELNTVIEKLQAEPTANEPNPFDAALMEVDLPLDTVLKGVDVASFIAIPTIGELAKAQIVEAL